MRIAFLIFVALPLCCLAEAAVDCSANALEKPGYPRIAILARVMGTYTASARVASDGRLQDVSVEAPDVIQSEIRDSL